MHAFRLTMPALVAGLVALAGCGGNAAQQIATNVQMRDQVMSEIASHGDLAVQMAQRLAASDSTRARVMDVMLKDDHVAQYVIVRIATNADALDLTLGAAMRDSAMRGHVMTLLKGMQMASKGAQ